MADGEQTGAARVPARGEYVRRRLGRPTRTIETKGLIDAFLVCTVATVIVIRIFLEILGYPQLGGGKLHVAHLLWGGLLMLLALVLASVFITRSTRWAAMVIGGIGFGLFIDEVGKFVTSDNDYFFKPTFALIYVALILIWLGARAFLVQPRPRTAEARANAIDLLKEASVRDLTEEERRSALWLLDQGGGGHPFDDALRGLLEGLPVVARPRPFLGTRAVGWARATYARLATTRLARGLITAVFLILTAVALVSVASLAHKLAAGEEPFHFEDWANLASNCVLSIMYVLGVYALFHRARVTAYRWFELAVLFSIFVVQVFDFADYGPIAAVELVIALVLLVTLHLVIAEEERQTGAAPSATMVSRLTEPVLAAPNRLLRGGSDRS